jgi:hypothetical protein
MKMKNIFKTVLFLLGFIPTFLNAQAVEKKILVLGVKYYNDNNISQHLIIQAKSKIDGKFQKIGNIPVKVFINNENDKNNFIGTGTTTERGELLLLVPASAKTEWSKSNNQAFVATSTATTLYDEARGELAITKAKLKIDTIDGKMVHAKLLVLIDSTWKPMVGIEMVLTVKRLGGNLNISETATYTTDTAGAVTGEFKRENLPGDNKGNLVLVANVIDNDIYGNLTAETTVPWGSKLIYSTNYNHRSLFARRGHSPFWLEFLAYGIILAVWVVIIYLVLQIKKIVKLGLE